METNEAIQDGDSGEELESNQQSENDTNENQEGVEETEGGEKTEKQAAGKKGDTTKEEKKQLAKELAQEHDDYLVTIKVQGKEQKISVRDLKKNVQLEHASRAKMEESDKVMKAARAAMELLRRDPKEFLKRTGIDPYEFAEATLAEKYELMSMTEEQKKIHAYEQELKKFKDDDKERKETKEKEEFSKAETEEMTKLDKEIGEAWKESGLPKHPHFAAKIAFKMLSASKQGKDLQAGEAASMIKNEFHNDIREILQSLDADAIQTLLGQDVLKKLRESDVKRVQGRNAETIRQQKGPVNSASQPKSKNLSEKEWRKQIDDLANGLTN